MPELLKKRDALVAKLQGTCGEDGGRVCSGEVDGVMTATVPYHVTRKHEYRLVHLGDEGTVFAREITYTPWNFLQDIRVWYRVFLDCATYREAKEIVSRAGVTALVSAQEYSNPKRWDCTVDTLEDVVKLWKMCPTWASQHPE